MIKKISLGVIALVAVAGGVAGMSAFEAHVINVTAKIENALRVDTVAIDFGTVFPQEELERPLEIWLSESFLSEGRVDDIEYIIRQKPKCAVTEDRGRVLVKGFPTATGHVDPVTGEISCGPEPDGIGTDQTWDVLPSLCEYISKHPDNDPDNDGSLNSFHVPYTLGTDPTTGDPIVDWLDTLGRLSKLELDEHDLWTIDLAVPCFGDHCAQDWEGFVRGVNPDALPADQWVQPIENEHKIFGCDLWIEVTEVSEVPEPATLTVIKEVIDDPSIDIDLGVDDFDLFVDATPVASGVANVFSVGGHVVSETPVLGYSSVISGDCDLAGNVTLNPGDSKTCTITNTEVGDN